VVSAQQIPFGNDSKKSKNNSKGKNAGISTLRRAKPPHSGKDRPMGTPVAARSGRDDSGW
jgi:hypothetical protein